MSGPGTRGTPSPTRERRAPKCREPPSGRGAAHPRPENGMGGGSRDGYRDERREGRAGGSAKTAARTSRGRAALVGVHQGRRSAWARRGAGTVRNGCGRVDARASGAGSEHIYRGGRAGAVPVRERETRIYDKHCV